jgi:hypothetical protein
MLPPAPQFFTIPETEDSATVARVRAGRRSRVVEFAPDSTLEGAGFEPPIPPEEGSGPSRFASF